MEKSKKWKKAFKVTLNVLTYVFIIFCLMAVIFSLLGKKSEDGATEIFGYQLRIVQSDSMSSYEGFDTSKFEIGAIPVKSMVFVQSVPEENADEWYENIKAGDVLTFRYVYSGKQHTITHRVVDIEKKTTGGYLIKLKGDNKASENSDTLEQIIDTSIEESTNYVLGKVVGQSVFMGAVVSAVSTPIGLICIVIVPSTIIIILEVVKIVGILNKTKKEKEKEEKKQLSEEIELLKKQLSELNQQDKSEQDESK